MSAINSQRTLSRGQQTFHELEGTRTGHDNNMTCTGVAYTNN